MFQQIRIDQKKEWVKYQDLIDFAEIHNLYHKSDLGIFASTCENMPNILIEMMASGLPIVCSNFGPMPEILGEGVYFNPLKINEIASSIEYMFMNPDFRIQNGKSNYLPLIYDWHKSSKHVFSLSDVYNKFTNYYKIRKFIRYVTIYGLSRSFIKAFVVTSIF